MVSSLLLMCRTKKCGFQNFGYLLLKSRVTYLKARIFLHISFLKYIVFYKLMCLFSFRANIF
jgi:hypothetical protein